jgi:hypothetical protein
LKTSEVLEYSDHCFHFQLFQKEDEVFQASHKLLSQESTNNNINNDIKSKATTI